MDGKISLAMLKTVVYPAIGVTATSRKAVYADVLINSAKIQHNNWACKAMSESMARENSQYWLTNLKRHYSLSPEAERTIREAFIRYLMTETERIFDDPTRPGGELEE